MRNGTDHRASARPKSITIVQTQQHSVILPDSTPSFCQVSLRHFAKFHSVILSSFTRFLDLSLGGFHSAVVPSDGLEPRHVTGRIDMWTEMCDRRKCNDTFRSIPSSVLLTSATAGAENCESGPADMTAGIYAAHAGMKPVVSSQRCEVLGPQYFHVPDLL